MRPLPRLESEPKLGAVFAQLFISAALNDTKTLPNTLRHYNEQQLNPTQ